MKNKSFALPAGRQVRESIIFNFDISILHLLSCQELNEEQQKPKKESAY
jgi:hypothetical protein